MSIVKGVYRHITSGNMYRVVGTARKTEDPLSGLVIYSQLYKGNLRGTTIKLPVGTLWAREPSEFEKKFEFVSPW
jgi:hypothetical protein